MLPCARIRLIIRPQQCAIKTRLRYRIEHDVHTDPASLKAVEIANALRSKLGVLLITCEMYLEGY